MTTYTLLLEDDPDYADLIKHTLERAGHQVVTFDRVAPAIAFAERKAPALAILDVMLPDGSGIDTCQRLRVRFPELPILFLSSLDRSVDICTGLDSGGDDYLTKPFYPQELLARIKALLRRRGIATSSGGAPVAEDNSGLVINKDAGIVTYNGRTVHCTSIETAILAELVAQPGQPLSHAFLAERVWGYSAVRDATLLKGHISSIRQKLRDAGAPARLVTTLHGVGYLFQDNDSTTETFNAPHNLAS